MKEFLQDYETFKKKYICKIIMGKRILHVFLSTEGNTFVKLFHKIVLKSLKVHLKYKKKKQ